MGELQFDKYKSYLKDIVEHYGHRADINPTFCFSPDHENTNTESMVLYDTHFECKSCGVKGDIYDAVGLLAGLHDKVEQFKQVEQILGKSNFTEIKKKPKKEQFKPNLSALDKLKKYVQSQAADNRDKIIEYLEQRNCTNEMIDYISKGLGYWPGYETVLEDIGKHVIFNAGIPGKNPKTKTYSWGPAGPVALMGLGLKLFYYNESGESKKIGSKAVKIFPAFLSKKSKYEKLYLTEGEMSALAMKSAGFDDVSPTGGVNGLSEDNMEALLPYPKIYIVFDGDTAGKKNLHTLKDKMRSFGVDGDIYIVRLPKGEDPDDLIKAGKLNVITDAIQKSEKAAAEIETAVENAETEKNKPYAPFYFAGYDERNYYVVPKNQSIPIAVGRTDGAIKGLMFDIAPPDYWYKRFIKENKEGKATFDILAAIEWFRVKGQKSGIYDHNKALGVGPHVDNEKIVFNLGDSLYLFDDKKKIEYPDYEGSKFYIRSTEKFDIDGESWELPECRRLYKEIRKYGFTHKIDFMLIAGWIVLAPFASILDRRPHLAVIGQKGSGKTTLVDFIIKPAIGEIGLYVEGETTEAGARQAIGRDCRPCIIDEFEANTLDKKKRVEGILTLARSAFGGSAETIKGTQSQKALIFRTRVMFMFLAVKVDLLNDANRSRIPIIDVKNLNRQLDNDFDFTGLRRRTFENLDRVLELTKIVREYMKQYKFDNRTLDTYSTLIAGFWFLVSDSEFLKDDTEKLNESISEAIKNIITKANKDDPDEIMILNYIFNHIVRLAPDSELSVFEMLTITHEDGELSPYKKQLSRLGIRRDVELLIEGKTYDALAVSAHHGKLQDILKNTEYFDYKDMLRRHPAVIFEDTKSIYMLAEKQKQRCIIFDWEEIRKHHFVETENINGQMDIPF